MRTAKSLGFDVFHDGFPLVADKFMVDQKLHDTALPTPLCILAVHSRHYRLVSYFNPLYVSVGLGRLKRNMAALFVFVTGLIRLRAAVFVSFRMQACGLLPLPNPLPRREGTGCRSPSLFAA